MRPARLFAVAALLLVTGWPSTATMLISMDLPELVSSAVTIAYGRVSDARVAVIDGRIETVVTLAASTYLKGEAAPHVTFRVPGGQIGRYRTVVVGAPVLEVGDEIVAFLDSRGPGLPIVVGFSQGVLRVVRERLDMTPMVLAPPSLHTTDRAQRIVRGEAPRRFVALSAFMQDVRGLAVAQAAHAPTALRRPLSGTTDGGR